MIASTPHVRIHNRLLVQSPPKLGDNQLCRGHGYRQGDHGPQEKYLDELAEAKGDTRFQYQYPDLGHVDQLRDRNRYDDKSRQLAFDAFCQYRRQEHIGNADCIIG